MSIVSFAIIYLAPGDPTDRFRSGRVSAETIANLIRLYGLDKPLPEQFFKWFTAFWPFPFRSGAWGYSFVDGRPVMEKVFEKVPTTLQLMSDGAHRHDRGLDPAGHARRGQAVQWADKIITTLATIGYALPSFVLGLMLLYVFAIKLELVPAIRAADARRGWEPRRHARGTCSCP